jgi:hypothetical protein
VSAPATSLTGVTAEASRFWEQALARFLSLKIADDLTPDDAPDVDRGVDDYCRAMDWLIESVPSPDIHALAYKVRLSVERAAPFAEPLYADHARGILADIQRLSVMALAAAPQADPHPLWLEDRNRLHQLANRHAPMPQAFMDDLIASDHGRGLGRKSRTPAPAPVRGLRPERGSGKRPSGGSRGQVRL